MIERVAWGARLVERALGLVIGVLVLLLLGIVLLQLVDRHFFNVGIAAPDQLVRIGVVWLCFLGFAAALQAGVNIRIEFLEHWLGARARVVLAVVFDLAMLALCVLLAVKGMRVIEVGAGQQLLGTPFTAALPNTGFVAGVGLTGLFVLARLVRVLSGRPVS
jgi:TRAP-type C4-dicarboxylate transport system permease small subunit